MRPFQALILAGFLSLLSACRGAPHEEAIELRTYDVPKGTASTLVATIKDVMWMGDNKLVGRAVVTPDGRLAVLATPSVQTGVQTLVDEITKHPPAADQTVVLHYFLVIGKSAPSAQPLPAGTTEIKGALEEIVRSQGPQTFTLVQRVALSTMHDEEGRLDQFGTKENGGAALEIRQVAVQTNEGVYAKLLIRWRDDKVETRVQLAPEKMVVLGATGQHAGDAAEGGTLYYVVRVAPRADGKSP